MDIKMNRDAREDFQNLDTRQKGAFQDAQKHLKAWPATPGVKALSGRWKGHSRIVICKDWRVIFRVLPNTEHPDHLTIVRIRHRSIVYD